MARRNSKEVRFSSMTDRQLKRLLKKKKNVKKNDLNDWTDSVLKKINNSKDEQK